MRTVAVLLLAFLAVAFAVECTIDATRTCETSTPPDKCPTLAPPVLKETCCRNCVPCSETERKTCNAAQPSPPPKCAPGTAPTIASTCCQSCVFCTDAERTACSRDIPKCVGDAKPEFNGGCCPSCAQCTETDRQQCPVVAKCAADTKPTFAACCPSCSLCDAADFAACSTQTIPTCEPNVFPTRNGCCPSCRSAPCECQSEIPVCTADQKPVWVPEKCCPSCKPSGGVVGPTCTETQIVACKAGFEALPVCAVGVLPTRLENCCQSCRVAATNPCEGKAEACRASLATLPVCAADTKPVFDSATCCVNCRPPPPPPAEAPVEGKCTEEAFRACLATAPVCTDGQAQVRVDGTCCPTCKRAESASYCTPTSVAKCLDSVQVCAGDQRPSVLPGECCVTCKPAPPTCNPACDEKQICVPTRVEGQDKPVPACRGKLAVCVKIVAKAAALKEQLAGMTKEQARNFVVELVNRFCEKNENSERCAKFSEEIANLKAESFDNSKLGADGAVDFCLAVAAAREPPKEVAAGLAMRLFATADSSAALVADAMKDPGTTAAGFDASITSDSGAASSLTSSPALMAAVAAGLIVVQLI